MADTPNFSASASASASASPYPWSALPRLSRDAAASESALARLLAVEPTTWVRLRRLVRLDSRDRVVAQLVGRSSSMDSASHASAMVSASHVSAMASGSHVSSFDPNAAVCEVRVDGAALVVRGDNRGVRELVQRIAGGPEELAAPRPLGLTEQALWCLVVATALEDLGVPGHVWPVVTGLSVATAPRDASPSAASPSAASPSAASPRDASPSAASPTIATLATFAVSVGSTRLLVELCAPRDVMARLPRAAREHAARQAERTTAARPTWIDRVVFDVPTVVGRCAVHRDDLARLAVRSLVTLERPAGGAAPAELTVFAGGVGIRLVGQGGGAATVGRGGRATAAATASAPFGQVGWGPQAGHVGNVGWGPQAGHVGHVGHVGPVGQPERTTGAQPGGPVPPGGEALGAEVVTGYVPRDMTLPDEAHVELTVALGTTQLSLRQITELAVGQIVQLGRPLGGPFELRAAGRVLGRGELVDVDGELAVRIVSLGD